LSCQRQGQGERQLCDWLGPRERKTRHLRRKLGNREVHLSETEIMQKKRRLSFERQGQENWKSDREIKTRRFNGDR
jgi:hypothetical protein